MAGQGQRLNIVPTVTMHGVMKARLIGATGLRGATPYSKRGATRRCLDHSVPADPEEDGRHHEDIRFRLMEAKYVAGNNVKHVVLENVQSATLKVGKGGVERRRKRERGSREEEEDWKRDWPRGGKEGGGEEEGDEKGERERRRERETRTGGGTGLSRPGPAAARPDAQPYQRGRENLLYFQHLELIRLADIQLLLTRFGMYRFVIYLVA
uniref:Uncharacterized protein n=1 Tax=Nymphaea colorata TaxID=210225 RepID=A0A5K0XZH4_9MAGN